MKPAKSILALLAIFGAAATASADVTVHLTGSTAYRGQTNIAILRSFDNTADIKVLLTNAAVKSSAVSLFQGHIPGVTGITTVVTDFTGSVGGIAATVSGALLPYMDPAGTANVAALKTVTAPAGTHLTSTEVTSISVSSGSGLLSSYDKLAAASDLTMSDSYQNSTPFTANSLTSVAISGAAPEIVGVVPFTWIKSAPPATFTSPLDVNAYNRLTSVTPQQLQSIFNGLGTNNLALFTGLTSDNNIHVVTTGRDQDSGTRLGAFAEAGLGTYPTVTQYQPSTASYTGHGTLAVVTYTDFSNGYSVASLLASPTAALPIPNLSTDGTLAGEFMNSLGNGGASGGSKVAAWMGIQCADGIVISYLGTGDASTAVGLHAVPLAYNGVQYVTVSGTTATFQDYLIKNGEYTFWGYEHILQAAAIATGSDKDLAASAIATELYTNDAQVLLSDMKVSRSGDGLTVTPTGTF